MSKETSSMRDKQMDEVLRSKFFDPAAKAKRKKGILKFFIIMLVICILTSVVNWGIVSGWGKVKVSRLNISGPNNIEMSALLYVPSNATNETPAPIIFCWHGNAGNARNHESWAVEFARRGFVVLSPDLYGAGNSGQDTTALISNESMFVPVEIWYNYGVSLPYVDADHVVSSGHSMGTDVAAGIGAVYDTEVIMCASAGQPGALMSTKMDPLNEPYVEAFAHYNRNYIDVLGECETTPEKLVEIMTPILQSRTGFEDSEFVPEKVFGSFEEGNAFFACTESDRVHEAAFVSQKTIGHLLWFAQESLGDAVPNPISSDDQVWMYKDYVGLFGIFAFGLFICALALLLIEYVPFFEDIKRPIPRNIGMRKTGLAVSIVLALIFPYVVLKTNAFGLIGKIMGANKAASIPVDLFPLKYSDVGFCMLIGLNLLGVLGFLLYVFTEGKKNKITMSDLGLTPDGTNKISVKIILKVILLSAIVVAVAQNYIALVESLTGTDYYAWFFGFKSIHVAKIKYFWSYLVVWIICFVVASFTINVERRLPTTGNENWDTVIAMVFNVVLATIVLDVIIIVCWVLDGKSLGNAYPFWVFGTDIARLWGMPASMAVGIGGSTLLYRKTGNTWLSAILMGTVSCILCLTFGQLRAGL